MSKAAGGLRDRHGRDVLELLARARPASLDPGQNGPPAEQAAARLAAADGASLADPAGPVREMPAGPHPRRRPRRGLLAGAGLTVTAAAAAAAVLVATAGGGAPPVHRGPQPVLLTAATVRQVAAASRSALATSGRAVVAYRTTQSGVLQDSGTDNITFSGKNWNDSFSQTSPGAHGQPGHTQSAINRIVNGQFYLYIAGRTPRLQWYHDTNPSGHPSFTIPDPRTVLRALAPSARFVAAGYQVIGGLRLKELRATDPGHVPGLGALPDVDPQAHVTSLRVWVDGHGVVHRIGLGFESSSEVYPASAWNERRKADGTIIVTVPTKAMAAQLRAKLKKASNHPHMIIRVAPPGSAAPHREVQVTALTVTFSGIGQPQHITPPRHAIQQYGRG
jgi:hypothetical protein